LKLSLAEVIVIILICFLLFLILLPAITHRHGGDRVTNCGANLSQLVKAMYNYSISKTKTEGAFPDAPLGSDWWLLLHTTGEVDDPKVFLCPVLAEGMSGESDYRGPPVNPNLLGSSKPVGCDRPGNHGDEEDAAMNWVAKSGDVHKVPRNAEMWRTILASTRD
jgi:hypothetical protein